MCLKERVFLEVRYSFCDFADYFAKCSTGFLNMPYKLFKEDGLKKRWKNYISCNFKISDESFEQLIGSLLYFFWNFFIFFLVEFFFFKFSGSNRLLGDILCIIGSILYAIGNVCEEYLVKQNNRIEYLGMVSLFSSIISGIQL